MSGFQSFCHLAWTSIPLRTPPVLGGWDVGIWGFGLAGADGAVCLPPPGGRLVASLVPPWFGQPGGARQVIFQIGEVLLTAEECIDLRILEGDA